MITYINGEFCEKLSHSIVIESYGVGYEIMMPESMMNMLPEIGETLKIYTFQNVKEDALDLYGFITRDDLDVFKLLIKVNGIGPKGALNILSVMTPDDLRVAVLTDNVKLIQSAPGVGAKTAQKLIIELKDKLHIEDVGSIHSVEKDSVISGSLDEAVQALVSLGYSYTESMKATRSVLDHENMNSEELLKTALKQLAFL